MATITLNHITKIEGHAKLNLGIERGKITKCELSATEGSRYFEGLVRGRNYNEAHEITSRICGICSCAHVIAAIHAIEDAMDIPVSTQTRTLRKLITLGERIRSHATHLHFLALPDYLGYESALAMTSKYKVEVQRALKLMKTGNAMVKALGARDLHPVSATIGGWLKLPSQQQIDELLAQLQEVRKDAKEVCSLFLSLEYPSFESKGKWFSLKHAKEYPLLRGAFSSKKETFPKKDYKKFIKEYHESYSTANFVVKEDHRYMVGSLSRINNSSTKLSTTAKSFLKKSKIALPSTNPYDNLVAQAIELVDAIDQAITLCSTLKIKNELVKDFKIKKGRGIGMIEVPRGTLWHEYTLDKKGVIVDANIITPTAQNLLNIQEDIRELVPTILHKQKKDIIMDMEKLIRSYDPCFSCSAHFLEVTWE